MLFAAALTTALVTTASAAPKPSEAKPDGAVTIVPRVTELAGPDLSATLRWPEATGGTASGREAINDAISFGRVTNQSLEATKKEFTDCQCGVVGADYTVHASRAGGRLLSLTIEVERMAAYPTTERYDFAFDTASGARLDRGIIAKDERDALVAHLDAKLQGRIGAARENARRELGEDGIPAEMFEGSFTAADLDSFKLDAKGAHFSYDRFEFPHAVAALEPNGELLVPWAELGPFLAPSFAWIAKD